MRYDDEEINGMSCLMHGYVLMQRVAEGGAGDRETEPEGMDQEGDTCLPAL